MHLCIVAIPLQNKSEIMPNPPNGPIVPAIHTPGINTPETPMLLPSSTPTPIIAERSNERKVEVDHQDALTEGPSRPEHEESKENSED